MKSFEQRISFEEEAVEYHEDEGRLINEHSFDIIEEIGAGSFGHVYKVIKKDTQKTYALKVLSKAMLRSKKQLKYAIAECKYSNPLGIHLLYLYIGHFRPLDIYL